MSSIFTAVPGGVIYLDNIVLHGPAFALHNDCLHLVPAWHVYQIQPYPEQVHLLWACHGVCLICESLRPLQSKVEAVQRLLEPTCPILPPSLSEMTYSINAASHHTWQPQHYCVCYHNHWILWILWVTWICLKGIKASATFECTFILDIFSGTCCPYELINEHIIYLLLLKGVRNVLKKLIFLFSKDAE